MGRRIIVTDYVSADGVIEDPVGMEGSGLGNWTGQFNRGPDGDRFKHDELFGCESLLFGRVTYTAFAAVWPSVRDETGFAERINQMPKYVVSNSLEEAHWTNTTILSGDVLQRIRTLKESPGGDILIYGSASLVHALASNELIDAFTLMIYPTVLGRGKRLFPDGHRIPLELVDCKLLGSGIVAVRYHVNSVGRGPAI